MNVEEEYFDVLENIEFAITSTYREHPALIDAQVHNAVEWLMRLYSSEGKGRTAILPALKDELTQLVATRVKTMCDWRLGLPNESALPDIGAEALTPDEIVICLKRIRKSIDMWTKERGRQGYLKFVSRFIK